MTAVVLTGVDKVYPDGTHALRGLDLAVPEGELLVLLGPSGCGKSTLLRLIAGLEPVSAGTIAIAGAMVNQRRPQDRDVAMVFQNYALYPHMTVRENLAFPLRMRGVPRAQRRRRVEAVAELLELTDLLARRPAALSGGQRQRVAMGRALVREPAVFLMDEPLSNLDARLRTQIRGEIAALQRRLGITTLYVTHDQVEAMTLGQRVAVLRAGELQQVGSAADLYRRPANTFVAGFLGSPGMNLFRARLLAGPDGLGVQLGERTVTLPVPVAGHLERVNLSRSRGVIVGIRPEALQPVEPGRGVIDALIEHTEFLGNETLAYGRAGIDLIGGDGTARPARLAVRLAEARPGERLHLAVDPMDLRLFTLEGQAIGP